MNRGQIYPAIRAEFLGEGRLFGSGRFTEFGTGLAGALMGLEMLLLPRSIGNSHVLSILSPFLPCWLIAMPWLVGGGLVLAGLGAFWWRGYRNCNAARWLRFAGNGVNLVLWVYVTFASMLRFGGEFPMAIVFMWCAFACYRSSVICFRREVMAAGVDAKPGA